MRPFDIRSDHTSQSACGTGTPPPSRRRSLTMALRLRLGLDSHRSVVRGMLHWRIAGCIALRTRPNTGGLRAGISEDAAYILFPAAGVPLHLGKLEVLTRSPVSDKADRTEYRKPAPLLAVCLLFSCSIVSSPISTLRKPRRRRVIARLTWLLTRLIFPPRIYRSRFGRDPLSAHSTPIVVDHPHSIEISLGLAVSLSTFSVMTSSRSTKEPTRSSCDECRKRKLRCTPQPGGCARCITRGLSCTFSELSPFNLLVTSHHIED